MLFAIFMISCFPVDQPVDLDHYRAHFIRFLPTMYDEIKANLGEAITVEEIKKGIDYLISGKSPGPEGSASAFNKSFPE